MTSWNLKNLCVLNTRPEPSNRKLAEEICAAGGSALSLPVIETTVSDNPWVNELDLKKAQQAVFTSRAAVHFCFLKLKNWPAQITVTAVGHGTAEELVKHAIKVDFIPDMADSEHLLELENFQAVKNQLILLFKGVGGRNLMADTLKARGAMIQEVCVYQRRLPKSNPCQIRQWWQENIPDIILLTSVESIGNLFELMGRDAHNWLKEKTCLVLSQRIAQAAQAFGIKHILVCQPDSIMKALHQYNQRMTE